MTDSAGRYDAAAVLAVGKYEVTVEQIGFKKESRTGITLVLGQRAAVDIKLAVGEVQQTVQVEETAIQVGVTTAEFSGLVGEQQVKNLPLNGRSYDQLLTLNPGIVNYTSQRAGGIGTSNSVVGNMFSASGRRPQENLYSLNGVEFTSATEVNNTPGGTSGQQLGVDAVREFAVVKDAYGAEYAWKASRRSGEHYRDRLGLESSFTETRTSSCVIVRWMRGILLISLKSRTLNATCSAVRSAGRLRKTKRSSSRITRDFAKFWD